MKIPEAVFGGRRCGLLSICEGLSVRAERVGEYRLQQRVSSRDADRVRYSELATSLENSRLGATFPFKRKMVSLLFLDFKYLLRDEASNLSYSLAERFCDSTLVRHRLLK